MKQLGTTRQRSVQLPLGRGSRSQGSADTHGAPCRHRQLQGATICRYSLASSPADWEQLVAPSSSYHALEGAVDDPLLGNPLRRQEMLGTAWFGAIVEYEGVLVESAHEDHMRAWVEVSQAEGLPEPNVVLLERSEGMKSEQVIVELLRWARHPEDVARLAALKNEAFARLRHDRQPRAAPGAVRLLQMLASNDVPVAVVSPLPQEHLFEGLQRAGLAQYVDVVVAGEDFAAGRPDPMPYLETAQRLNRPEPRCIVVSGANTGTEAAHTVGMQCIAVASRLKMYELSAADLVVRDLEQLNLQNLKQLFGVEEGRAPILQAEAAEAAQAKAAVALADPDSGRGDDDGGGRGSQRPSGHLGRPW